MSAHFLTLRRGVMLLVGSALLALALFTDHGNMQIEGFFFGILLGSAPFILLHFALAKVFGTLAVGRLWCGWACWFGMVFELLPYPYSRYRHPDKFSKLRYLHFALSLGLVLVAIGTGVYGATGATGYLWFAIGLLAYYVLGIGLAFLLKDNRAFCKYACPLSVLMKAGSRFALVKVAGIAPNCDSCNVCVERCPMNIRIPEYILKGERVLSTECTLCSTCISICPQKALKLSVGLDVGGREEYDYVPPRFKRG